ncbi:putative sulfate exporter family transporter [Gemella sp. zg-570]|uniref:YeiH family protein n=1 Tax=Gemella sp. zg-570 TaxID=2840371 RepID=UPI001C0AD05B|nr:putative sulfate exporter family transporter [Gemella sp. zg-570]QWQ38922.1 putative sulfate exporter family transporter [Gemella sp. zg-570]
MFKEKNFYISFTITFIVSLCAMYLAKLPYLKLFGHLVLALVFGMLLQIILKDNLKTIKKSTAFISNKFLRVGIILLGFKLSVDKLFSEGKITILMAFLIVLFMIILTYLLCKFFKIENDLAILASCGCGICGAAAVMGVSSQIKAKTEDSVVAVAVVAILGTVFTLIEVALKPYLNLTDAGYGTFTGASLHEIAHAVAAGGAGGRLALEASILMKLSRVLMLVVVILALAIFKKNNSKEKAPLPYFILGFIAMSFIGSYVTVLKPLSPYLVDTAYILLGMAMAALGMNVDFKVLRQKGGRVLGACFISSFILMIACYLVVKFLL